MFSLSLSGFVCFIIGLLYIDFRIDFNILVARIYEGSQFTISDNILKYGFISEDITAVDSPNIPFKFLSILPLIIGIALIGIVRRLIVFRTTYDVFNLLVSCALVAIYWMIEKENGKMHSKRSDILSSASLSLSLAAFIKESLLFIAICHCLVFFGCIALLLSLRKSYQHEKEYKLKHD